MKGFYVRLRIQMKNRTRPSERQISTFNTSDAGAVASAWREPWSGGYKWWILRGRDSRLHSSKLLKCNLYNNLSHNYPNLLWQLRPTARWVGEFFWVFQPVRVHREQQDRRAGDGGLPAQDDQHCLGIGPLFSLPSHSLRQLSGRHRSVQGNFTIAPVE